MQEKIETKPELIAPAGSLEKLELAYRMGADACYMGSSAWSMRTRQNLVGKRHLEKAKDIAVRFGRKLYVCVNIFPHNRMLGGIVKHVSFLKGLNPDAIVFADPSVLEIARDSGLEVPMHLSVQSSASNHIAVRFWKRLGVSRVILARELTLGEIEEIKREVPEMELEAFVHGSVCMAYSGRCFISSVFSDRDANNGMCAHNCRNPFNVVSATVVNEKYPGQEMVIEEDIHGSHLISSRDMCLLPHLRRLADAGISGFKIEGRNKSEYYLAVAVRTYREAIDRAAKGEAFDPKLMDEVNRTANRGFFSGFYFPELEEKSEVGFDSTENVGELGFFTGIVRSASGNSISVSVRQKIHPGDTLRLLTEKYGTELLLKVERIINHRGEDTGSVSSGVEATLVIEGEADPSWEGLVLQRLETSLDVAAKAR